MKKRIQGLMSAALVAALLLVGCPSPSSDSPGKRSADVKAELPSGCPVAVSQLQVQAGINGTYAPDKDGRFSIVGGVGQPVVASAATPSGNLILMSLITGNGSHGLNVQTTAETLVFMGLGLFGCDAANFEDLRDAIAALPQTIELSSVLSQRIVADPEVLGTDSPDGEIVAALSAALTAASSVPRIVALASVARSPHARVVTIDPTKQSWLAITVDSQNRAIATNERLRFVAITVNGPGATSVDTLVPPCAPPTLLLSPSTTVLSPNPLGDPGSEDTYLYEVRARGGVDNSNGKFDHTIDLPHLAEAWCFTAAYDFVVPYVNITLGLSETATGMTTLATDLVFILAPAFDTFGANVQNGIESGDLNLPELAATLLMDSVDGMKSDWPGILEAVYGAAGVVIPQTVLANAFGLLSAAFRVISIASNALEMIVGVNDLVTASVVDTYTITLSCPPVAKPTFTPPEGMYNGGQSVTIDCTTEGASIRYTTNGVDPTSISGTIYTKGKPVPVSSTTTLKAIAYRAGWTDSVVATAAYTIGGPAYSIGDTGPAGGVVFYDNGGCFQGWRYLEAAPASTEWGAEQWGKYGIVVGGTGTAVGTGKANTTAIVEKLNEAPAESDRAAQLCDALSYGGYNDWFLPSKEELSLLYQQRAVVGGFRTAYYWSSSESNSYSAWTQDFREGYQYADYYKYSRHPVRAIRSF